jgi:hypothetical protein
MCDPISIGIGLAVATAGIGIAQNEAAADAAEAQQKAESAVFQQNRDVSIRQATERRENQNRRVEEANKAFARQVQRTEKRIDQLRASGAEDALTRRAEFIEARGSLLAAAGNTGGGGSIDQQLQNFSFKAGRAQTLADTNLRNQIDSLGDEMEDLHARAVSNALDVDPSPFLATDIIQSGRPDTTLANIGAVVGGAATGFSVANANPTPRPPARTNALSTRSGLQIGENSFLQE